MDTGESRRMALWYLQILRTGTILYNDMLPSLHRYLNAGSLTLADIGTTATELEHCRVEGCRLLALFWLQKLRNGSIMYPTYVSLLRQTLQEGRLHAEVVGSSESEIESFLCVSAETFQKRAREPIHYSYSQQGVDNPR